MQPLTDGIAAGVALAFGWDDDWATRPEGVDPLDEIRKRLRVQELALADLRAIVQTKLGMSPEQFGLAAEGSDGQPLATERRMNRPHPEPQD